MAGRPRTLAGWLRHAERLAPQPIVLGLQRVAEVWRRLGAPRVAARVYTVAGTNGKGSTAALLAAVLAAGGRRVGLYTSPHLLRYNERVRIAGEEASDEALALAFARVERARREVPLTYFEFGTLAAFLLFAEAGLDAAVLEVGLGGRLDAVNLLDPDVALLTTVDLDHREWLGPDREAIGREKAGIFRPGRPALVGEPDPPASVLDHARAIGAELWLSGRDFVFRDQGQGWIWQGRRVGPLRLPRPALAAPPQLSNAALALAAAVSAREEARRLGDAPRRGRAPVRQRGPRDRLADDPEIVLDVAHNPQAATVLAQWLAGDAERRPTFALFGALRDKDVAGMVQPLLPHIAEWHLCGLERSTPRGLSAAEVYARAKEALGGRIVALHPDPATALRGLCVSLPRQARILAFGSFHVGAAVLAALGTGRRDERRTRRPRSSARVRG
jgi:dihydrofolate synthase/folylpolyglutamate synthase